MRGFLKSVSLSLFGLMAMGLSGCGSDGNGSTFVVSIDVTPSSASVAKGDTLQLQAVATYSDDTTEDVTSQAIWTTSDPNVAAVGNAGASKGLVTGVLQRDQPVTITAVFDEVLGSATVTVTQSAPVRIDVSPVAPTIAKGTTQQLQAVVVFSDGSTQDITAQATWTSGAPTVASVDDSVGNKGLVTGLAQRAAPVAISAAFGDLAGTASITVGPPLPVRVEVTPATLSLPNGTTQQLTATAVYTDDSTQDVTDEANWESSAPAVVSVGNSEEDAGRITAQALTAAPVTITATFQTFSDTAEVTVTEAVLDEIQVSPSDVEVPAGLTRQFNATAIFTDGSSQSVTDSVQWSSSDPEVATVGNDEGIKGLLTGVAASQDPVTVSAAIGDITGTTEVTVTSGIVQSIEVQPASASLPRFGFKARFTATGRLSDGSTVDLTSQATWTSSAAAGIATISNSGNERGVATSGDTAGTSEIRAALGGVTSAAATLTVTNASLQSIELQADADPAPETELTLSLGRTLDLRAIGVFATAAGGPFGGSTTSRQDITQSVIWSSCVPASDPCDEADDIATVSNAAATKGRVVTQDPGDADIVAQITVNDGTTSTTRTGSLELTVTDASLVSLEVSPSTQTLAGGYRTPFTARGTFSDGSTGDVTTEVTWVTGNSNVATVSNEADEEGVSKGGAEGATAITAKWPGSTIEDSAQLTVTDAVLAQIAVTPTNATIRQGEQVRYVATGEFSDDTALDISRFNDVAWSSSDPNVAVITAATGIATGTAQGGPVSVTATKVVEGDDIDGSTQLSVSGYALANLVIVPQSAQGCSATPGTVERVPAGFARRFFACAVYFNGIVVNVTANAQWVSQAPDVVTVSNAGATKGRAAAVGSQGEQGVIRASFTDDGITESGTYTISVIDGEVESITITAEPALAGALPAGSVVSFTALADFSDGSDDVNITESATWVSTDPVVATISNADGSRGRATVVAVDEDDDDPPTETDITATAGGVTSNVLTIQRDNGP